MKNAHFSRVREVLREKREEEVFLDNERKGEEEVDDFGGYGCSR